MFSGTVDTMKDQGTGKIARCNEVSVYGGSFSHLLLSLGEENFSLSRGLSYLEVRYFKVR